MNPERIFNYLIFIVFSTTIAVIVRGFLADRFTIENPAFIIGTFMRYERSDRGKTDAVCNYIIGGKLFEVQSRVNKTLVPGDKFVICYNKDDPSDARLLMDRGVFLKGEKKGISKGYIIKAVDLKEMNLYQVFFQYNVDGVTYFREQDFPINMNIGLIDTQAQYNVIYWRDNPQRSIINLKKIIQ